MATKKMTFESGMEQLEALASALESGEMPLEESLEAYDKAVKLHKKLQEMLDQGDARIRVLTDGGEQEMIFPSSFW